MYPSKIIALAVAVSLAVCGSARAESSDREMEKILPVPRPLASDEAADIAKTSDREMEKILPVPRALASDEAADNAKTSDREMEKILPVPRALASDKVTDRSANNSHVDVLPY